MRGGVHIGGSDFFRVSAHPPGSEPVEAIEGLLATSMTETLGQVPWYARVPKRGHDADARQQAA